MVKKFVVATISFLALIGLFQLGSYFYFSEQGSKSLDATMKQLKALEGSIITSYNLKSAISLQAGFEKTQAALELNPRIRSLTMLDSTGVEIMALSYTTHTPSWLQQVQEIEGGVGGRYQLGYSVLTMGELELIVKGSMILLFSWIILSMLILVHTRSITPQDSKEVEAEPHSNTSEKKATSSEIHQEPAIKPMRTNEKDFLYRFEKEISRSAEHALDISVCLLKNHRGSATTQEAMNSLYKEFVHDDLVFELRNQTLAVILPHHDIDQAMARMELFLRKPHTQTEDFFEKCTLGLSSRSGRLVEAKRVYHEALIALKKADPKIGRMVGFKADPAKYRNFLTHQKV